jgi:hypothetical protein
MRSLPPKIFRLNPRVWSALHVVGSRLETIEGPPTGRARFRIQADRAETLEPLSPWIDLDSYGLESRDAEDRLGIVRAEAVTRVMPITRIIWGALVPTNTNETIVGVLRAAVLCYGGRT